MKTVALVLHVLRDPSHPIRWEIQRKKFDHRDGKWTNNRLGSWEMERNRYFSFFFFFVLSLRFTNVYQTQELANKRSVCSLPETIFIKIFFETLQRYLYYPECYINSSSFTYYHLYLHRYTERKKNRHFRVDNLYIYIYVYIILDCLFLEIQGEILVISVT